MSLLGEVRNVDRPVNQQLSLLFNTTERYRGRISADAAPVCQSPDPLSLHCYKQNVEILELVHLDVNFHPSLWTLNCKLPQSGGWRSSLEKPTKTHQPQKWKTSAVCRNSVCKHYNQNCDIFPGMEARPSLRHQHWAWNPTVPEIRGYSSHDVQTLFYFRFRINTDLSSYEYKFKTKFNMDWREHILCLPLVIKYD